MKSRTTTRAVAVISEAGSLCRWSRRIWWTWGVRRSWRIWWLSGRLRGRGGYGYHGGYGGWGWGGVGLGLGLYYASLPFYYSTFWGADGSPYYYADDNYYQWEGNANEYETVSPPPEVQQQAANQWPNLMAYPKNGQSDAQQATDKTECHTWAAAQSGFDPTQSAPARDRQTDQVTSALIICEPRRHAWKVAVIA